MRTRGLAPVSNKMQTHVQSYMDTTSTFPYPMQSFEVSAPTLKQAQKRMGESHGLLDLITKNRNMEGNMDMGDFASVTQENFAHALHFTKAEIDFGTFCIDEIETVCSQSIGESSVPRGNNNQVEANYLEDSLNSSNISYTETDIFIEMPNSEVLGSSKPQIENTNHSASF